MTHDLTGRLFKRIVPPLAAAAAPVVTRHLLRRNPLAYQRQLLRQLIRQAHSTGFGKDHRLRELSHLPFDELYRRFVRQVPIRSYDDFWQEYFAPHYRQIGERRQLTLNNVTWPGTIPFFCETSGTTAPTKFIPFSTEMFAANRRAALDLTAGYLSRTPDNRLLGGKILYMAGNTSLSTLGKGVQSGDMSAITLRHPPIYLRPFILPDPALSALPWGEKLDALAYLLLNDRSIRAISGVPPWILLLLQRASELGGAPLSDLSINLELIIHGGTSMAPYRREFDSLWDEHRPQLLEVLPSSEAFMAFQLPGEERMRLTPYYGAFFEFVPLEELDERGRPAPDASAVPLEGIELGKRYAVILTTCAGLWRYHIGDTLRVLCRDTLAMEFTGRDRFLDRFEEKITQGEVEGAVASLNRLPGVDIREFMVGPNIEQRQHLWVLAVGPQHSLPTAELADRLDNLLVTMNADYSTFRSQGRIAEPRLIVAESGTIYRWSKEVRGKLGGQSKIPHIDPTLAGDQIRSLADYATQQAR